MLFRLATTCGVYMLVLAPFGVFATWWGPFLAFGAQVLVGMAFAALVYGFSARLNSEEGFGVLFRLGVFPLFLFSGAFFPVANLGDVGAWVARLTPLWHGVNLSRMFCSTTSTWSMAAVNVAVLVGARRRLVLVGLRPDEAARLHDRPSRCSRSAPCGATRLLVLRNYIVYRKAWKLFLTGFLEPVFYLFSIGIGVGPLIEGFEFNGQQVPTPRSWRPACSRPRRSTARCIDSTYNVFFKLKYTSSTTRCSPPR